MNKDKKAFETYKIDTYQVSQYENERVCSEVQLLEVPKKYAKRVLCYVAVLKADCLVWIKDLNNTKRE